MTRASAPKPAQSLSRPAEPGPDTQQPRSGQIRVRQFPRSTLEQDSEVRSTSKDTLPQFRISTFRSCFEESNNIWFDVCLDPERNWTPETDSRKPGSGPECA